MDYFEKEFLRVRTNLYKSERKPFGTRDDLANWFVGKLKEQNLKCFYCETSILDIEKLIDAKLLKVRKVKGDGCRGLVLEIDKNDETYIPDNCVLSCYYCNNDKSYTSEKEEYKQNFGENRGRYFAKLIFKLNTQTI
jgi:hypothetical protein